MKPPEMLGGKGPFTAADPRARDTAVRVGDGSARPSAAGRAPRFHLLPRSHADPFLHIRKLRFKCIFHLDFLPPHPMLFDLKVS